MNTTPSHISQDEGREHEAKERAVMGYLKGIMVSIGDLMEDTKHEEKYTVYYFILLFTFIDVLARFWDSYQNERTDHNEKTESKGKSTNEEIFTVWVERFLLTPENTKAATIATHVSAKNLWGIRNANVHFAGMTEVISLSSGRHIKIGPTESSEAEVSKLGIFIVGADDLRVALANGTILMMSELLREIEKAQKTGQSRSYVRKIDFVYQKYMNNGAVILPLL